jgi:hypothetical protein
VKYLRQRVLKESSSGLNLEMDTIYRLVYEIIEEETGLVLDKDTFKVRVYPNSKEGVDTHVDLDYVTKTMQKKDLCVHCNKHIVDNGSHQDGLHWTTACRKIPVDPSVFTIAVNLGEIPMAFISFGTKANISRNKNGHLVPVLTAKQASSMTEVVLEPGQGVVFSAWVVHKSAPDSLKGTRISLDVRARVSESINCIMDIVNNK